MRYKMQIYPFEFNGNFNTFFCFFFFLAFTWFALSEYILAVSNMAFHFTITLDFPHEQLIVAKNFPTIKAD